MPSYGVSVYADWTALPRLHLIPSADIASSRWTVTSAALITYYRTRAYVNAAIKAEYALKGGTSISASVRKLLDEKYHLVDGFPEAGRSYQLAFLAAY